MNRPPLQLKGGWTNQDVRDAENAKSMERFRMTETTISVKYRSPDDKSGWYRHPLEDTLKITAPIKEKNNVAIPTTSQPEGQGKQNPEVQPRQP